MVKKKIVAVILLLCLCVLFGCKWKKQTDIGIIVYTDKETGVQYLIYNDTSNGTGMCPRYNSDGSLMTEK